MYVYRVWFGTSDPDESLVEGEQYFETLRAAEDFARSMRRCQEPLAVDIERKELAKLPARELAVALLNHERSCRLTPLAGGFRIAEQIIRSEPFRDTTLVRSYTDPDRRPRGEEVLG